MQAIFLGIDHLVEALEGSSKVMVVCDNSFPYLNIREDVEKMALPFVLFDRFTPNPLYESVCEGVSFFNSEQCDTILAVGGGSAIDVAKCIKLYCRMSNDSIYFKQPYQDTRVKLIAVPTTAGTGSESTRFAVIYFEGKKQSIAHDSIIPTYAILEPKVLKTLPQYQKKCTMMDALCQGIESWWSVNSTEESQQYSKIAVETIIQNWRDYIFNNSDLAAEKILFAANYSGRAICITQTTAPHAFSYKITSMYGIPHGHAVSVCLPEIWEYMIQHPEDCVDSRGKDHIEMVFYSIAKSLGSASVEEAIGVFRSMMKEMELMSPEARNNKESEITELSKSVNPIRLANNPISLSEAQIYNIYNTIIN